MSKWFFAFPASVWSEHENCLQEGQDREDGLTLNNCLFHPTPMAAMYVAWHKMMIFSQIHFKIMFDYYYYYYYYYLNLL